MNINNVLYTGILVKINNMPFHITLDFLGKKSREEKRKIINDTPLNLITDIKITHYGQYAPNGQLENVAYKVELPKYINELFNCSIPHITIATYNNGRAVNSYKCFTNDGLCTPLEKPVIIKGVVKYFNHKNEPLEIGAAFESE